MPQRTVRLQSHELFGEPELDALLTDPVMLTLWRADHIDPDEARRLFARTTAMLYRRGHGNRTAGTDRQNERADDRQTAVASFAMI